MSGKLCKYAALADLSYARPTEDDPIDISLLDYQAEGAPIEESNGFYGQSFKSNDSTEIVVSIRATDFEDISLNGDWVNNVASALDCGDNTPKSNAGALCLVNSVRRHCNCVMAIRRAKIFLAGDDGAPWHEK